MSRKHSEKRIVAANQNVKERQYWFEKLSGELEKSVFPFDFKDETPDNQWTYADESIEITPESNTKLNTISKNSDYSLNLCLTTAAIILLGKYSGNRDIIIGQPIYKAQVEGELINSALALRNILAENTTGKQFLMQVRQTISEAIDNLNYPIEILVDQLELEIHNDKFPLFDVAVLLKNIHDEKDILNLNPNIIFSFERIDQTITGHLKYNSQLYRPQTILQIVTHFQTFLSRWLNNLDQDIDQIECLTDSEKKRILEVFNNTHSNYPKDKTLHQLFEEQVEKNPDRIAVTGNSFATRTTNQVTYSQLNELTNHIAARLIDQGVQPDTIVGIKIDRSIEMMIGIFGILKSGGAYLPIDPQFPQDRIDYMLKDSSVNIVLTVESILENQKATKPFQKSKNLSSGSAAYIIYTSGTTGKPKGNLTMHTNVSRVVKETNYITIEPTDNLLQLSNYAFDGSTFDIFGALLNGAKLVLIPKDEVIDITKLNQRLIDHAITVFFVTTALFNAIVEINLQSLRTIRKVLFGGERISVPHTQKALAYLGKGKMIHVYGPTETTVFATYYNIDTIFPQEITVPIGSPIANTEAYILNPRNQIQPITVVGELYLSGTGLARGYLNNPQLTQDKFIEIALTPQINPGHKTLLYRTGDLARWDFNGNIEFVGRADSQVKLRGFRIELGEIESRIVTHPAVKEAFVMAREDSPGNMTLCAYFVSLEDLSPTELRNFLTGSLPEYMIPSHFIPLEKIPLNPNGKVDKKALPKPDNSSRTSQDEYIPPRNPLEKQLVEIWSKVLDPNTPVESSTIGVNSNFFSIGGHSLKATEVVSQIHKHLHVNIELKDFFAHSTIAELVQIIQNTQRTTYIQIQPAEEKKYYPLSSAQKRLYILHKMAPEELHYNMPQLIPLGTSINLEKLQETFQRLIQRHQSLRTTFHQIDETPVQFIHPFAPMKIETISLPPQLSPENQPEIQSFHHLIAFQKEFVRPFDLTQPPLIRAAIINTHPQYYLLLDIHHIITDGTSQEILVKEFITLYTQENPTLPQLNIHYKDYAEWQNSPSRKEAVEKQAQYWLNEFSQEIPTINLPNDYQRPVFQSFDGDSISFALTPKETEQLKEINRLQQATLFMMLLTLYHILLTKLSGQEEIVIGTVTAGRRHADLLNIVGMFVNTLPLKIEAHPHTHFLEHLHNVKNKTLLAFENQDYQFEDLVEKVVVNRDLSRNPIFDVMLILQNQGESKDQPLPPQSTDENNDTISFPQSAKFDLTLTCVETPNNLCFSLQYCTKLFKRETIQRMVTYFKRIVSLVIQDQHLKISDIDILSEEERNRLLNDFNNTASPFPEDKTIHQLFEEQVIKTPHHTALITENNLELTYSELNEKANQLAHYLMEKGVKTGTIVPLITERSIEMIIGIFGILKTGAAYLPIDPKYPQNRIDYMLIDSASKIILADASVELNQDYDIINLEDTCSRLNSINSHAQTEIPDSTPPFSLAYVIYTSGSTGNPKGVLVEHRSAVNVLTALQSKYPLNADNTYLFKTPYIFDVSVSELFGWFHNGGRLAILEKNAEKDPYKILDAIETYHVTHINFVPPMFNVFSEILDQTNFDKLKSLKYIFLAGEALLPTIVEKFRHFKTSIQLENLYGPTEATVYTTHYSLTQWEGSTHIPIGKPINNLKIAILGNQNRIQPIGVPGELCIAGIGIARGYLNRPELTDEKFMYQGLFLKKPPLDPAKTFDEKTNEKLLEVQKPFHEKVFGPRREKLYRSGDLARWMNDGNIEFIGRIDHQVKIRGYRIELGEIENRLLQHRQIKDAVVLCHEANNDKNLCAYLVPAQENDTLEPDQISKYLAETLAEYMIPTNYIQIPFIPLTPSGKLDRRALPTPENRAGQDYLPPQNPEENTLADIWAEILGRDKNTISVKDNFFRIGGHSLKATILTTRIHKDFNVKIPLTEIFRLQTIRTQAQYIQNAQKHHYQNIQTVEEKEHYPLSSAQKRLYVLYQMAPAELHYNMPQYLPLGNNIDKDKMENVFRQLINRHESLRTSFHSIHETIVQKIHQAVDFEIETIDNTQGASDLNILRPFDLSIAPLLRVAIIRNPGDNVLLVDMHHIISDGTSLSILTNEFTQLYYSDQSNPLPPLKIQYKAYAEWQKSSDYQQSIKDQEAYWINKFSDQLPVLSIPTDYRRPAVQSFEGDDIYFFSNPQETAQIREFDQKHNATTFMFVLSILDILLAKLSGQDDIIVGTVTAGRSHADLQNIIGMFVNTLALRNFPNENNETNKTYTDFLNEVKENTLQAFENQDYQFEDLVEKITVNRDMSRNPVFDVMISFENRTGIPYVKETPEEPTQRPETTPVVSKFDITLNCFEWENHIQYRFEYSAKLFKKETMKQFATYFKRIITSVLRQDYIKLGHIDILSPEEKRQILIDFNNAHHDAPLHKTIHQVVAEQSMQNSDRAALVAPSLFMNHEYVEITYKELEEKSHQLAQLLLARGIKPTDIIAVEMPRTIELIVSILGILKIGGVYLPIEPTYPEERKQYILKDSGAALILNQQELTNLIAPQYPIGQLLPQLPAVSTQFPAYIIYTSGTTGNPKGVMIEHHSLINLIFNIRDVFHLTPQDHMLQSTTVCFDPSIQQIFTSLLSGLTLVIIDNETLQEPERFYAFILRHVITYIDIVPSLLNVLPLKAASYVKQIICGGEVCPVSFARELSSHYRFFNAYGPTEATVTATLWEVKNLDENAFQVPIGKPVPNTSVFILNSSMLPVPPLVIGELYIAGEGLARGYLNRPELTAEKFFHWIPVDSFYKNHPLDPHKNSSLENNENNQKLLEVQKPFHEKVFGPRRDILLYRTGDLARWTSDGNIEYFGRTDEQVKIRGNRIELGEIENQCRAIPNVSDAVVIAREDQHHSKYLCAYITTEGEEIDTQQVKSLLSQKLPVYMIPSFILKIDRIPLTSNGKVDRKRLPVPEIITSQAYIPPRNEIESKIVQVWSEVLGVQKEVIGIDDSFFDIGGNSIRIIGVHTRLKEELQMNIPVVKLFTYPTIRALSNYLSNEEAEVPVIGEDRSETISSRRNKLKDRRKR